MTNDVIINKIQIIKRCLKRIKEEYNNEPTNLENLTKQDSMVLNIQRAAEACIDLAMHIVSEKRLGIPQNSRDAFDILYQNKLIDLPLANKLQAMVGFRNIAMHDYQSLNIIIIKSIIENHLGDFEEFSTAILKISDFGY